MMSTVNNYERGFAEGREQAIRECAEVALNLEGNSTWPDIKIGAGLIHRGILSLLSSSAGISEKADAMMGNEKATLHQPAAWIWQVVHLIRDGPTTYTSHEKPCDYIMEQYNPVPLYPSLPTPPALSQEERT